MINSPYFHFSGGLLAAVLFLLAMLFLFVFLPVSLVSEAFSRLGVTPVQGILLLLAILLGRSVNIPIYTSDRLVMVPKMPTRTFVHTEEGGIEYIEEDPANELKKQVFAINLGGIIMPILLSITFVMRQQSLGGPIPDPTVTGVCTLLVAIATFAVAKPDPLMGIRIPMVMPALAALISVYFMSQGPQAPITAYIAGTMGAILGGCVAPLAMKTTRNSLAMPLVALGGSGSFGSIFLAGILSVLLV